MMDKNFNEMLIRNVDCGLLYWKVKDLDKIESYEKLKLELKSLTDPKKIAESKEEIERLSKDIFTFKGKEVEFPDRDNRFMYSGTIADSLMGRKLRQVANERNDKKAIRSIGGTDYTDIIINIKFKQDIMIPDVKEPEVFKTFNPETQKFEEVESNEKNLKKLISKKKLRKMAYKDGVFINGVHYVNFQRTSSKARTGNCLFIRDDYFEEMDAWQNMGIPFKELDGADIVGIRSYQSLTSSSIIGELDIDPYSILLIDEVTGSATMDCHVVKLNADKQLEVKREAYTQYTDLWDGQSLLDRSVFKEKYKDSGFILLRNHFFKTAVFNTNIQDYYKERFKGVDNPVLTDAFGNEIPVGQVKMVTTRNSAKIFKFADMICKYMVPESEKTDLQILERPYERARDEDLQNYRAIATAKRKLTKERKSKDATPESIHAAEMKLQSVMKFYNDNHERLLAEMKACEKAVKHERERLTWNWYRKTIKEQGQRFGCCKTEHKSKFGDKQQLWYQVLGSLNFNRDQIKKLIDPQIQEINLMKKHVAWFKYGIGMRPEDESIGSSMMLALLNKNEDVSRTKWYTDFRRNYINRMVELILSGKIQIKDSDFCTLVGNPYEMLRASVGDKIETSIINDFECYCPRYKDGEELYGMRSPHICTGNNALLHNVWRDEWKWFNFTDNIIVINLWGKGAFLSPTWNGSDQDSDTAYIGNDPTILEEVKKVQADYLIPINQVPQKVKKYEFENVQMATVDGQLCNDMIGKICNFARDLQALYWHLYNTGTPESKAKYLDEIYGDICILEVLSNIAIDSAKRQYECNVASEMARIKSKPYMSIAGAIVKDEKIVFEEKKYRRNLTDEDIKEYECFVKNRNKAKTLEEVEKWNTEIDELILAKAKTHMIRPDFTKILTTEPKKKFSKAKQTPEQMEINRQKQLAYAQEQKLLKERLYRKLESPMDILAEIVKESVVRSDRTKYLPCFVDILKQVPKGVKPDNNRIKAIKEACYKAKKRIDFLQVEYNQGHKDFDEFFEERQTLKAEVIRDIASRKVTTWDIHRLIRDVYDIRPEKDSHGKVKMEKGKPVLKDKRDKLLIDNKLGGLMLQWVYAAHQKEFIDTVKDGSVSYIQEYDKKSLSEIKVSNLKELKSQFQEIFDLDGKKYIIKHKPV